MILNEQKTSFTMDEKKKQLFLRQKELLDTFLEHGAITQQQHDKSLHDLTEKMGIDETPAKATANSCFRKIEIGLEEAISYEKSFLLSDSTMKNAK